MATNRKISTQMRYDEKLYEKTKMNYELLTHKSNIL